MAPPNLGQRHKPSGRPKANIKTLKRKRDAEDLEGLEQAVEELVSKNLIVCSHTTLMYFRI
jgi:hypothetical protein